MSDILQLKPCPYCQSDNVGVECSRGSDDDGMIRHFYYGFCGGCHMAGPDVSNEEGEGIAEEQAAAAWNSLPRNLYWTKDVPPTSGKYMYRDKDGTAFADVNIEDETVWLIDRDCIADLDELNGEWAGPILEPLRHAHQRRPEKG